MEPSRQVQRAEFRAEVKRGMRQRKIRDRQKKNAAMGANRSETSTLRVAAMTAVSRICRATQLANRIKNFSS